MADDGEKKTQPDAGKTDDVWNDPYLQINEGDDDKRSDKDKADKKSQAETKVVDQGHRESRHQKLHNKIARRYTPAAKATVPPQGNITQQRNVIIKRDGSFTGRTVRGGCHKRVSLRKSHNANIEKTPHDGTEDKNRDRNEKRYGE
jgi:hypothetical protein